MRVPALGAVLALATLSSAVAEELPQSYQDAIHGLRTASDPTARALAAIGLGHGFRGVQATSDPRVGEALQEASTLDPDPTVRTLAAYGLCARGDRRGVTRVVATLRERETQGADPQGVYSDAIRLPVPYLYRALGHAGGPEATRFLIEAAERAPQAVRLVAIPALALVRDDDGVERTLAALAGDRDPAVRGVAAYVLGERSRWRARP